MPKKQKITPRQVKSISRMLAANEPVAKIVKAVKVSQTTVERVRADYRAVTFEAALDRLDKGDYLPDIEYKRAEIRARIVPPDVRTAIIAGIIEAKLRAEDILDEVPKDPRLAFAPQEVEPEHKPVRK
jgi:hypothetical protein